MKLEKNVIKPSSVLIEQTAADLCAAFYEAGLSAGLKSKSKTHKAFVHKNIEHFIPKAVELLVEMLGNPATPDSQKEAIAEALIERANDPDLSFLNEKIDWKAPEKRPEIIKASRFDTLWAKSKKDILHG